MILSLLLALSVSAAEPTPLPTAIVLSADETEALQKADQLLVEANREARHVVEKAQAFQMGVFEPIFNRRGKPQGFQLSADRKRLEFPTPAPTATRTPTPVPTAKP